MRDTTTTLSAAVLRLVGEIGYATLDWLTAGPVAATAELDQHVAAIRADLSRCQRPAGSGRLGRAAVSAAVRRVGARRREPADCNGVSDAASPDLAGPDPVSQCPNIPFVASPLRAEPVLPLRLLLHYASGFIEAAVRDDWWPGDIGNGEVDWACLRLAAICRLISQAEADADLHPDLRNFALTNHGGNGPRRRGS